MSKHKTQKAISILLTLALTGTIVPCGAANVVPFNAGKPVVPPAEIKFSDSVTPIAENSFAGCSWLNASIIIPKKS